MKCIIVVFAVMVLWWRLSSSSDLGPVSAGAGGSVDTAAPKAVDDSSVVDVDGNDAAAKPATKTKRAKSKITKPALTKKQAKKFDALVKGGMVRHRK